MATVGDVGIDFIHGNVGKTRGGGESPFSLRACHLKNSFFGPFFSTEARTGITPKGRREVILENFLKKNNVVGAETTIITTFFAAPPAMWPTLGMDPEVELEPAEEQGSRDGGLRGGGLAG